jgi:GNAT superfamily N-acetyltransferase
LFIEPELRGKGIGKALLVHLAKRAVREGCGRLQWWVLDWNEPSIAFYKSIGAEPMEEWTVFRVSGDALARLASER